MHALSSISKGKKFEDVAAERRSYQWFVAACR